LDEFIAGLVVGWTTLTTGWCCWELFKVRRQLAFFLKPVKEKKP